MSNACLITGGAGFIGCALTQQLSAYFDRVVALDNLHPQVHASPQRPAFLHQDAELVIGDVADQSVWDDLLKELKPRVIVHLAAETGTAQSLLEASRHSLTNVVGTTTMTDALARHDAIPEKIVLASSRAVYGEGRWRDENGTYHYPGMRTHQMLLSGQWQFPGLQPTAQISSQVRAEPANVYAATKLAQENLLTAWCGSMGVELVKYRLQNVYGVGQSLTNPYTGIISMFARWAKSGQVIPVYEDGNIVRDFVYITDTAQALLAGILHGHTNRYAYDIGTGVKTTIMEAARTTARIYDAPEPEITGQFREGDIRSGFADISAATTELGWHPQVTLTQGLHQLTDWLNEGEQI